MYKGIKKLAAALLTAAMLLNVAGGAMAATKSQTTGPTETEAPQTEAPQKEKEHDTFKTTTALYRIRKSWQNYKTITVPKNEKFGGKTYTVKEIRGDAFAKCKNVKTIVLPNTLTTIRGKAFHGATKLKTIKIKSKNKIKVYKTAFKGLTTSKMTIIVTNKMSKTRFNALKKQLRKVGFKGKIQRKKI